MLFLRNGMRTAVVFFLSHTNVLLQFNGHLIFIQFQDRIYTPRVHFNLGAMYEVYGGVYIDCKTYLFFQCPLNQDINNCFKYIYMDVLDARFILSNYHRAGYVN